MQPAYYVFRILYPSPKYNIIYIICFSTSRITMQLQHCAVFSCSRLGLLRCKLAHTHTHTHTFFSPSRAAAAVTARLVPALVRPLRPLAPKPGFSRPLLKPLPLYKQGQTERQAWLAGMYSCFAFPSSKLAEQKMLTFCSSWSWPHWGLWPPSGSAPSSPPLLPLPRLLLPRAALWRS